MKKILSWKQYKKSIEELGFYISIKDIFIKAILLEAAIILVSLLYRINIVYIAFLCLLGFIILPYIIKYSFHYRYEQKRFMDICSYMEQMCSSFQKQSKIFSALKDTSKVLDGKLKKTVDKAIEYMNHGICSEKDIFTETLEIIEKEYECKKLSSLHRLFIKIELEGGEYHRALNILLKDINNWMERTMLFQKEKRSMRVNYIIALILSILTCTLATIMSYISKGQNSFLSSYLDITGNSIYQIVSVLFISSCLISLLLIQKKYTGSWLEEKKNEKLILDDYETSLNYNYKEKMKRRFPFAIIFILLIGVLVWLKFYMYSIIILIIGLLFIIFPMIKYRGAKSRTIDEIKISFPEWLIDISLNLQYYTIHMAISRSYDNAPIVLKQPIEKLILEINENLTGIEPYHNFLSEFDVIDVKSAMRMLYSMTELSHDKSNEMLDILIERNYAIQSKSEKDYINNKTLALKQLLYMPMFFCMFKVVIDLVLFATSFFNGFSDFSNFIS